METRPADQESGYVFHHANTSVVLGWTTTERRRGLSSSAVGKRVDLYPEDAGKLLRPDDQLHFSSASLPDTAREVVDAKLQVGLWFYPEGEEPKYTTNDETGRTIRVRVVDLGLPRYTDLLIPPHGYQMLRGNFVLERERAGSLAYAAICTFEAGIR